MSVGNLKDQGNKGNNFPYQFRTLKLLGEILNNTSAILSVIGGGTPSLYYDFLVTPGQTVFIPPNFAMVVGSTPLVIVNGTFQPNGWTVQAGNALIFNPDPGFAGGEHVIIIK